MIHMCRELDNGSDYCEYLQVKSDLLKDRGDYEGALQVLQEEEAIKRKYYNKAGLMERLVQKGMPTENLEELEALLKGSEEGGEDNLAPSPGNQALLRERAGDLAGALTLHRQAGEIYAKHGDKTGLAFALERQAEIHKALGELDRATELIRQVEDILRQVGNRYGLADALNEHAEIQFVAGNLEEVTAVLRDLATLIRTEGNTPQLRTTLGRLAETLCARGDHRDAVGVLSELKLLCQEAGDNASVRVCDRMIEQAGKQGSVQSGDSGPGSGTASGLLGPTHRTVHPPDPALRHLIRKGNAAQAAGEFQEALTCFDQALALLGRGEADLGRTGNPFMPTLLMNKGNALAGLGRLPEALACFDQAMAMLERADQADSRLFAMVLMNKAGNLVHLERLYPRHSKTG
jgi:tetratricopeptide (TPR) repeat protein